MSINLFYISRMTSLLKAEGRGRGGGRREIQIKSVAIKHGNDLHVFSLYERFQEIIKHYTGFWSFGLCRTSDLLPYKAYFFSCGGERVFSNAGSTEVILSRKVWGLFTYVSYTKSRPITSN